MFRLTCPKCGAGPDEARLEVVSGMFRASKMWLREDGFATMDAKSFDTDDEAVLCHACGRFFSLGDCVDSGPAPSFEPFKGWDWSELAARFGVAIPDEDDPTPLADFLAEWHTKNDSEKDRIAATCREFLEALVSADPSYNRPVWEGLVKVKDDDTLIAFMTKLIGWMWT